MPAAAGCDTYSWGTSAPSGPAVLQMVLYTVAPADGDTATRARAEDKIRKRLESVFAGEGDASKLDDIPNGKNLPAGVEEIEVSPTDKTRDSMKGAKQALSDASATAWKLECTAATNHLKRLLNLDDKKARDLYCSLDAVDGRGARSVLTAIRAHLREQGPMSVDPFAGVFPSEPVPETPEFLYKHPMVRVDGFGFRHFPATGECFALASEQNEDGSVGRTWVAVGIWGVSEINGGAMVTDWVYVPTLRFAVHSLRDNDDQTEYAALFGDAALPRQTVSERREDIRRRCDDAARAVDNQTPASSERKRVTPVQLGSAVSAAVSAVPGITSAQVAAIVAAMQSPAAVSAQTVSDAGRSYRVPAFDEALEFQKLIDREVQADDLRNLPVAIRWSKAAERARLRWPAVRHSFEPPPETMDDGRSQEKGDGTGGGSDDSRSDEGWETDGSEDDDESEEDSDDADSRRNRRRDDKQKRAMEEKRKSLV